ncbi:alpha/beta fold hydrolase [Paractinoplanes maris]|uniref:alpha/beta fold hydrolase n=1 Tax=Paractinoplanes maris TaxID=1734446 RepID=UPI0020204F15|nr:alpha/beta fold hydrolase [Actinoplanes maris]
MTLETAIRADDTVTVSELISSGADPHRRESDGQTPLMIAAGLGRTRVVELLLAAGADVLSAEPRMGATALHKAAQSGDTDVLGCLLDHGALVDQQSARLGHTPLMDAVQHKHEAAVRLLLARGARATIRNHWRETALDLARRDQSDVMVGLLRAHIATEADRVRAARLPAAAEAGDLAEVERLIAAGAPLDERLPAVGEHDDDYTALGLAARDGHTDIVRVLLDAGADPRRLNGLMRATPGHEAAFAGHAEVLQVLTAPGTALDLDAQGAYNGFTALHDAVWHGNREAVQALMEAGARLDLVSHTGHTPRQLADLYRYDDLARLLLEAERIAIRPRPFAFPQAALDDLRERLTRTRWPRPEPVRDWSQGAPSARMRALCDYWRDSYDWRACETRLNGFDPSTTRIDGVDIHFLHLRSPEPDATPLVMTHGWPGSVVEFLKIAPLLADPRAYGADPRDAFHVVLPSLPGFGLSGQPAETGWGPERIARAWVELMRRLGYDRFVAQGGDWGHAVTTALGGIGEPAVRAIHSNMFPTYGTEQAVDEQEARALQRWRDFEANESGYRHEQMQSPQTVGYALTDSPVGQAAWIYEKYEQWTDHGGDPETLLSRDEMLDNITLYWLTGTAASAARIYWESFRSYRDPKVEVPVGVSLFPRDIYLASRRWVEDKYPNLVHYNELPRGGHFAAWEQPELLAEEIRATFRHLR